MRYTRTARIRATVGSTAYQRIKGRATSGQTLMGFGEICNFKNIFHEKLTAESSHRENTGNWIGIGATTGQCVVWDGKQIQHARMIA